MADMGGIAKEIFQILLRYDYTVKLYDEDGMLVAEPAEARRFFAASPNLLVSLNDAGDDSNIKLMFGKSTHADDIAGLMQALRTTANTKYNMTFEPQQYGGEIDPKKYRDLMSVSESLKDKHMKLCEGLYGTSTKSYLQLANAKLIIEHRDRIDPRQVDGRAQQIANIFIEVNGERRLPFPSTDLATARRMVEHISAGGSWFDPEGQAIVQRALPRDLGPPKLAENNPVVRDFLEWTKSFEPLRALSETNDPYSPLHDQDDRAQDDAIDGFSVDEFMESPDLHDVLGGRDGDSADPDDRQISRDEVLDALESYLRKHIERHSDGFDDGYQGDTRSTAEAVYDQVAQAMKDNGFMIVGEEPEESLERLAGDEIVDPEPTHSGQIILDDIDEPDMITREDVLLPSRNKAVGLSHEVTKSVVHGFPGQEEQPDRAYTDRLRTLAGMKDH